MDHDAAAELERSAEKIGRDFVRRYATDRPEYPHSTSEMDAAVHLVHLCARAISGDHDVEDEPPGFEETGTRAAAKGHSPAEAIEWIRGLESAVTDFFISVAGGDVATLRLGIARLSSLFDGLCARHLDTYSETYDSLAGWYTRVGTDLVSYLVSGAPMDATFVNSQARALNVDPHQPFRAVAVMQERGTSPHQWALVRRRFASLFKQHEPRQSVLVMEQDMLLLAIVPAGTGEPTLVDRLRKLSADEELQRTLYVSTGEPVDKLELAGRSCRQALSALEIGHYRGHRGKVTQCTEVILEVLLTHNQWVSHRIVNSRLGNIVDKPHLIETLRAYIACDLSLQRTAEELFIHPNTVSYRMRQVAKLTGRDMRNIIDLTELTVALASLDVTTMRADQERGHNDLRAVLLAEH